MSSYWVRAWVARLPPMRSRQRSRARLRSLSSIAAKTIGLCRQTPGLPPAYRSRAVIDPRGVLSEFGVTLPEAMKIRVWDSTAELRYIVVPMRPSETEGWSEADLADLVSRDSMIGTGLATLPGAGR